MELITDLSAKNRFLDNLKLFMDKKGLSYKDLGDKCGFSKQRVSDLFNKENNLSLNTTDKISSSLGLKETDLFQDDFPKKIHK